MLTAEEFKTQLVENPVNWILSLALLALLQSFLRELLGTTSSAKAPQVGSTPDTYNWLPPKYPESRIWRRYTPTELRPFDGTNGAPILLSINRQVFDVTAGKSFYGPGGPYENFAGRDASRGMAKQSFDDDVLTPVDAPIDDLAGLTASERQNMDEWSAHFSGKYILVGELVDP